jgi:hypothetical protein
MGRKPAAEGGVGDLGQPLVQHLVQGFAVQRMRHRLTNTHIGHVGLFGVDHHEVRAQTARIVDGQLLVRARLDDLLGRRVHRDVQVAGLQAGHPGQLVGHRAQHHFIEVHRALPVGAVAHEHDLRATPPFLEDERARTDRVGHVVFTMFLGRGGRHDHARGVGQGGEEVRRGRLHLEHDFQRSGRLDAADARQVGGPAVAVLGVHQALEVFDDRGRIEGRLVMELTPLRSFSEPGGVG